MATPMMCPRCGIPMNHHAEKLLQASGHEASTPFDAILGGIVEELHACPACGAGASRRAGEER